MSIHGPESVVRVIVGGGGGDLLAENNLSDLDNAATARTNLGLGSAAEADTTDFAPAPGADDNYVTDAEKTKLSNLSGTNTGDQTTITGNAGTATALQTARNIDGQAFDGTAAITVIAPGTHAASSKTTPVDADEIPLVDSAASNVLKKLTWANLKATAKAYFDTLYAPKTVPTIQKFTSGSDTYTTPANVRWIRVRMVGGGGGGGGSGTGATGGAGGTGGNTTFGTTLLAANGGVGGGVAYGGAGGSASLGTGPIGLAFSGAVGGGSLGGPGTSYVFTGGDGASSPLGGAGGGPGLTGGSAVANTGSGGSGGGFTGVQANAGGGGGAGGFVDAIITSPSSTYSYAVGAAGTAGTAGTSGNAGGAGGSGLIIVEEYY